MKKIILLAVPLLLACIAVAQIPTSSLVAYWPMNGNLQDYSSNSNHGTNYGATLTCDRCGNKNMAYHFDGITSSVVVNNSATIDMTNNTDFSISFWMKVSSNPTQDGTPIDKNLYGSWSGYMFMTNNTNSGYCTTPGQVSFYTASSAWQDACANSPIALGGTPSTDSLCNDGWIHVTGVYDGNLQLNYLYINSILQNDVGSISGNLSNSVNLIFGAHPIGGLSFFKGDLDDIRIYKAKLTQTEINALYAETCPLLTGIENNRSNENSVVLYPNPTKGVLNIELETANTNIQLVNCLGQIIFSEVITDQNFSYDLSKQANGVYFLKVISNNKLQVIKVIKE
jgi:hypothetical protein